MALRVGEYDTIINDAINDQQRAMNQTVVDTQRMQNFPDYMWRLRQERFQVSQLLQQHERKLLAIREELKQAVIKQKSLQILKDKDYAKYKHTLEKAEEEFLAEIALGRITRQMQNR